MTLRRFFHVLWLYTIKNGTDRAEYCKKKGIYGMIGDNVMIMDRSIPLFASLIRIHNNVWIASGVRFVTHDVVHRMLNNMPGNDGQHVEKVGCIEIMDNVFVGTGSLIMYNVRINSNVIVAAGSVVTKDVPSGCVVGGVPAKFICSFDEYLKRRKKQQYPEELKPVNQVMNAALRDYMWQEYEESRKDRRVAGELRNA